MAYLKHILYGLWLAGFIYTFSGCAVSQELSASLETQKKKEAIMRAYLNDIKKSDGLQVKEAVILAQSELIFQGYDTRYYILNPRIVSEDEKYIKIKFYPRSKVLPEALRRIPLFVRIQKESGRIEIQNIS